MIQNIEIERKFLVHKLPESIQLKKGLKIRQAYIFTTEQFELRIREKGNEFFQTIKKGSGLRREEYEIAITKEQFDHLWKATENGRIVKRRHEIHQNNFVIELDIYKENLEGLMIVEIEFSDIDNAKSFDIPNWFGKEVTEDNAYKNKSLAKFGLPQSMNE